MELDNEHILPLLGYIVEGRLKTPSLVSEWMHKGTLHDFMKTFVRGSLETCMMVRFHTNRDLENELRENFTLALRNRIRHRVSAFEEDNSCGFEKRSSESLN